MDKDKYLNKVITIPNILSLFRVLLIPLIIWMYCYANNYLCTLIVIVVSGLTDVIDGFIARRFNMISNVGKIFDPLADKLTQITIINCLITTYKYMIIPLLVLIVKDLFVAILSFIVVKKTGIVTGAKWYGKLCTVILFLMSIVHMIWFNIPLFVSWVIVIISSVMIITSGLLYGFMDIKLLKKQEVLC